MNRTDDLKSLFSISPSNEPETKWSKNSLQEIVRKVKALGKAMGYDLDITYSTLDSHYGFITCGSHVFARTNTVRYIVGRVYADNARKLTSATHEKEAGKLYEKCTAMDCNPDGVQFKADTKTPADNAKLIAEYIFGVLVQDALMKATFTQLVNSIVCETLHPKTLMRLRQDGYLLNTFEQVQKTFRCLAHASIVPCKEILY